MSLGTHYKVLNHLLREKKVFICLTFYDFFPVRKFPDQRNYLYRSSRHIPNLCKRASVETETGKIEIGKNEFINFQKYHPMFLSVCALWSMI
jgi:hypothetical protein